MKSNISDSFIKVGKIKDALGLKGHLKFLIFSGDYSWLDGLEFIHLATPGGELEKFEILSLKTDHKTASFHLNGMSNRNQAEEMIGKEIYVNSEIFKSNDQEKPYLAEILHFSVVDNEKGPVGKVIGFSSNGSQDLLIVDFQNEKVEIPFVDAYVTKLDRNEQTIFMNLPEGLLEINKK